jgi:hypothetical protein
VLAWLVVFDIGDVSDVILGDDGKLLRPINNDIQLK